MKNTIFALLLTCALSGLSSAQQPKVFDWVHASEEAVQLDPADYHTGRVYRPGPDGGNIHVGIKSALPVTVALAVAAEWNQAVTNPEALPNVQFRCIREHVVDTIYECHLPPNTPMVLTIHDERSVDRTVTHGIGAIVRGVRGAKQLVSPNELVITYNSWSCVKNCIQPEFQWALLAKEKYELTFMPKVYNVFTPEHDGQQVHVWLKAPVPMLVAVVPAEFADQIYSKPETIDTALAKTTCKQRGVQKLDFECKFNVADGPQTLVLRPESVAKVPKKKAEIELQAIKCVANCNVPAQGEDRQ